ncbi:MAG: acyl-CoA thioesterase, partial [Planctomycetota bacterium]
MPHDFKLLRTVEFFETDMAGIVHFSNYFRYMEATEHAFFRSFGATVHEQSEGRS